MPKSSSPSPTITPMNPTKTHPQTLTLNPTTVSAGGVAEDEDAEDIFHTYHLHPQSVFLVEDDDAGHLTSGPNSNNPTSTQPLEDAHPQSPFSSLLFRDPDEDEEDEEEEIDSPAAGDEDVGEEDRKGEVKPSNAGISGAAEPVLPRVDPSPHISSQFYTFNRESHALMVRCILEGRLALPEEIRQATPRPVLTSWRLVWKDRNEDTAYLTAWKRIQDKLHAHVDVHGNPSLYFKNNPAQRVSHFEQWQDIVASFHADPDLLRHLGLKETVDRIKQSWTVGAKFYGIPESFIRDCITSCPVCSLSTSIAGSSPFGSGSAGRSKRRRFEYTESLDVPAKDVPRRLQQLAAKHKVVLCIRQKYIRYKPFMAEVKDYACHRAGEPSSSAASNSTRKPRALKRESYQSKRCGCGFRIRAIVPITNYNEKDKTFVYLEEGTAVFKLYAVHSGHEPGPLDGNARIIHRMVGQKSGFEFDPPDVYGVQDDTEQESFVELIVKDDCYDPHHTVLQQVQELRLEASLLERKMAKMTLQSLSSLSRELSDVLIRLRNFTGQEFSGETLAMGDDRIGHWGSEHNQNLDDHDRIFCHKDSENIDQDGNDFDSTLGVIEPWGGMAVECQDQKMLIQGSSKSDKWLLKEDCSDFDEKSMLNCDDVEDTKLIKPLRLDGTIVTDSNLVGMQVDGFYPENTKWYDSPCGLDTGTDSGDVGFRHGGLL
ncbi:hypothetical protein HPP92_025370 [Vanilla planifolia]|uniref:Uncharacterized protein n=1 Tax=Vanilla planifolia TaxID=51239 RepID=A0A835U985_VANPL|nr:hypothetical protein HPP92_025672 [Vanilla planifolia]KAG0454066.1 hypothetical protein HPP92_025370 [Vanilla planifolia]